MACSGQSPVAFVWPGRLAGCASASELVGPCAVSGRAGTKPACKLTDWRGWPTLKRRPPPLVHVNIYRNFQPATATVENINLAERGAKFNATWRRCPNIQPAIRLPVRQPASQPASRPWPSFCTLMVEAIEGGHIRFAGSSRL